jgi:hypothetical protein
MREIAATLQWMSAELARVARSLRRHSDRQVLDLEITLESLSSTLSMYAGVARSIASFEGEPEYTEHAASVTACRYGCLNPIECKFTHAGCDHCRTAREGTALPELADLVGSGVRAVVAVDVESEADMAIRGSGS